MKEEGAEWRWKVKEIRTTDKFLNNCIRGMNKEYENVE